MQLLVCFCHICQASCLILVYTKGMNQVSDMYKLSAHISNEHCRPWGAFGVGFASVGLCRLLLLLATSPWWALLLLLLLLPPGRETTASPHSSYLQRWCVS